MISSAILAVTGGAAAQHVPSHAALVMRAQKNHLGQTSFFSVFTMDMEVYACLLLLYPERFDESLSVTLFLKIKKNK